MLVLAEAVDDMPMAMMMAFSSFMLAVGMDGLVGEGIEELKQSRSTVVSINVHR